MLRPNGLTISFLSQNRLFKDTYECLNSRKSKYRDSFFVFANKLVEELAEGGSLAVAVADDIIDMWYVTGET